MCEICRSYPCHPRCPNADEPIPVEICSICNEWICVGDEYIKNNDGEYAHWDCVSFGRDLVEFLGYEIQEMEDY